MKGFMMHVDPSVTMLYVKRLRPKPAQDPVARWALYSERCGFYRPLPHETEVLYESRRLAVAARLSGSLYEYRPVRVELRRTKSAKGAR